MLAFLVGMLVGGFLMLLVLGLCRAAAAADELAQEAHRDRSLAELEQDLRP